MNRPSRRVLWLGFFVVCGLWLSLVLATHVRALSLIGRGVATHDDKAQIPAHNCPQQRQRQQPTIMPLEELLMGGGDVQKEGDCRSPMVWAHDVWRPDPYANGTRRIPRYVHLSMKSRCLPQDLYPTLTKWASALPDHSVLFHNDEAVDRLLYETEWPEFPHLKQLLHCVLSKGAMKIDLWRLLVVYRYGGVYSDMDGWPGPAFSEDTILSTDQALFMSDWMHRPSQAFFAMEPRHPIAFMALREALNRLAVQEDVVKPKVVFVTGPGAVRHAYGRFLGWTEGTTTNIFRQEGVYTGKFHNRTVRKLHRTKSAQHVLGNLGGTFDDIVQYNNTNMTRRERTEAQSGVIHWPKEFDGIKHYRKKSCENLLYELYNNNNNNNNNNNVTQ